MNESELDFDVVIPAYNASETIVEQLDAVRRNDRFGLREVLVVDSCSTDSTAELVAEYSIDWAKVRLVSATRPGANPARNTGVRAGSARLVLMCDADDVVADDWARRLLDGLSHHDLVRGRYKLDMLNDPSTIAARGPVGSATPPASGSSIDGLGGNCGFRRTAWEGLDGLSEAHTGSDDVEFFWRASLAGLSVGYVDDAVVHYRLRPAYLDMYRQQRSWAANRALLYKGFGATGLINRRPLPSALKQWTWLLAHLRTARSKDPVERGRWVRALATAVGHLHGSVRHRVWFP